jgi:hypothetical protein
MLVPVMTIGTSCSTFVLIFKEGENDARLKGLVKAEAVARATIKVASDRRMVV